MKPILGLLGLLLASPAGVVSPSPVPSHSPQPAGLTPEAIMRAQESLSYAGTLLINGNQKVKIAHGDGDRQRQEFLGADGQVSDVVVSDGALRWHWMPRAKTVKITPLDALHNIEQRLGLIRKNYRFTVMGQARQAGRVVLLTQFTPLHRGNLTHRLWVDLDTHLPLVVERRSEAGRLVDRSEYLRIDYAPRFDTQTFRFKVPEGSHVESTSTVLAHGDGPATLPKGMNFKPGLPRELPEGYQLLSWQYFLGNTQVPTFNWRFHDGLNMLSLFATDERQAAKLPADARQVSAGKLTASLLESRGSRMLTWKTNGVSYTLVGHLPTEDLLQIARSTL